MQLMLHQRQNRKREQQKDAERTFHNHALQDYQMQMMLLDRQRKLVLEDAKRAKGPSK